jgi:hypothetical protein
VQAASKGNFQIQTIYVLDENGKARPVRVRLGLTDGAFVAVSGDGITEGTRVITGINQGRAGAAKQQPGGFGGGGRSGGGRRGPGF